MSAKRLIKRHILLMLSIMSRSIDTVASPKKVFKEGVRKLESDFDIEFEVLQRKELDPFHEGHLGLMARMFVDYEE